MAFFPFTFNPDRSIEVYNETNAYFDANDDIAEKIESLSWIYHGLHDAIPTTTENIWSGHQFPFIESWEELQVSCTLAQFGLYKQAMCSLRSVLELGLLSVYYNINDLGHETVKKWLASKDSSDANTPYFSDVWKILIANSNIKKYHEKINLKQRLLDLGYLHNYVHTKGYKFSNHIGLLKTNSQTFEKIGLGNWLRALEEVVILIVSLHVMKYPASMIDYDYSMKFGIDIPAFPHMRQFTLNRIKTVFPTDIITALQEISGDDDEVKEFKNWIDSHSDMTEKEVENQIIEIDKREIERQGFVSYLRNQLVLYRAETIELLSAGVKERVKALEVWAKENNSYEDKFPNIGKQ